MANDEANVASPLPLAPFPGQGPSHLALPLAESDKENQGFPNMGPQSQSCNGSVKRCKKRATGLRRLVQRDIRGNRAFDQFVDCKICRVHKKRKVTGLPIPLPHKSHHPLCPRNTKTKGFLSDRDVQNAQDAKELEAKNSEPIKWQSGVPKEAKGFFDRRSTSEKADSPSTKPPPPVLPSSPPKLKPDSDSISLGTHLRRVLEERLDLFQKGSHFQSARGNTAPLPILLLFHHIANLVTCQRSKDKGTTASFNSIQKIEMRETFFDEGDCFFRFPVDPSPDPHPKYFQVTGKSIFMLDWDGMFPGCTLTCPRCKLGKLKHHRTQFSQNWNLFPLINPDGTTSWGSVMRHHCNHCEACVRANDPSLLCSLPPHMRQKYPVEPRYANGGFHLTVGASDELESIMVTYGNADFFAKKLYQSAANQFCRHLECWASIHPTRNGRHYKIGLHEWLGRLPPTGESIRSCYLAAEESTNNPWGISNINRGNRELQSVGVGLGQTTCCIDWTFAVVKNYYKTGAKACFTMKVGTGETACLLLVKNTSVAEVAHGLQQLVLRRPVLFPRVLHTDTWPSTQQFWEGIFGTHLVGRLGLFHAMHRIVDTFDRVHNELHWRALVKLKRCFYRYEDEDWANLRKAFHEGLLGDGQQKLNDQDIDRLMHSKRWKQNYEQYLRKRILPEYTIKKNLQEFAMEFKDEQDEDGKKLFTRRTLDTIKEQEDKIKYIQDPNIDGHSVYDQIPAPKNSKHGLCTWWSNRLESYLERYHQAAAHFGNVGMSDSLADALTMRGTCEDNVRIRHLKSRRDGKLQKTKVRDSAYPDFFRKVPQHNNHSKLHCLNKLFQQKGMSHPFPEVNETTRDNGERFLSKYFESQQHRNQLHNPTRLGDQCNCDLCVVKEFPLLTLPQDSHAYDERTLMCHMIDCQQSQSQISQITEESVLAARENEPKEQQFLEGNLQTCHPTPRASLQPAAQRTKPALVPPQINNRFSTMLPCGIVNPYLLPFSPSFVTLCPRDACFPAPPYHCGKYSSYKIKRKEGRVSGRPPHDPNCDKKAKSGWKKGPGHAV